MNELKLLQEKEQKNTLDTDGKNVENSNWKQ